MREVNGGNVKKWEVVMLVFMEAIRVDVIKVTTCKSLSFLHSDSSSLFMNLCIFFPFIVRTKLKTSFICGKAQPERSPHT